MWGRLQQLCFELETLQTDVGGQDISMRFEYEQTYRQAAPSV